MQTILTELRKVSTNVNLHGPRTAQAEMGRYILQIYSVPPFNSLPNGKVLDWSKFKELADNKMNVSEKLKG